ncbi:MAG: carboxypeptidase-like regulatory domain-containing protein [Terracidiphilus sp.]|nr:carboxypeptidase-like regulatory domain-containing protein [Terracidiphilus sp.]MDR3775442.1 carboxypeptidase-like regulatory domain-containing protein [Terracidiphilus sp.]
MRSMVRLILFCLPLCAAIACLAQSTNSGDIRGSVTDTTGALIPDVTVTVVNVNTGVSKDFITNRDGLYDTSSILTGSYQLTFTKPGFGQFVRGPITLQVGVATVNAQLNIGAASEQVVVNTDIPLLTTETGEQGNTWEAKDLEELPQVGADWANFMFLLPGGSGGGASTTATNGNLPYTNILQNGSTTTLPSSQNATPALSENVAELKFSMSSFSAQYGIGGLVINQITKSGSNQFHGTGYDYIQNNAWNAAQFGFLSKPTVPYIRYNNFGGAVGGPILKKKMFFYFDYDQIVDHGSASNTTSSVPTADVMNGIFTGQLPIYDPFTQTIAYDSQGNPYPVRKSFSSEYGAGNAIPSALRDKVATKFQQFYPTATSHLGGGKFVDGSIGADGQLQNNFYSSLPQSTPARRYFGRFDYDITPNNRLTMSDSQDDSPAVWSSAVTPCPIGCESADVTDNQAQITDVWNISPTVINEARFGYTFEDSDYGDLALGKGYAAKLGWKFGVLDDFPGVQFTRNSPYANIQPGTNAIYIQHVFDPSDVVTMIRGKHVLHFGGEFLIYRDDSTAWGNANAGTMQFSGQYTEQWVVDPKICGSSVASGTACPDPTTGLEYADFLLGTSQSWSANFSPEYGARLKSPQVFVQDDYKVRPNLTVNLGIRYQINHGWNEVHGNEASFDPKVVNQATNTLGAYWYGNTHANGRESLQANVFSTVMPRVGFSWLPRPNTTIRGGFGLFSYNWSLDNYGNGMGSALPSSGSIADQTNGITPVTKLDGAGTIYGTATVLPYSAASTDTTRFNGTAVSYNQYHTPVPKIYQWNLAIQRQLGTNLMAEVGYVGSHGYNLSYPTDLNAVPVSKLSSSDTQYRPYPQYQSISGSTNNGISNYNSLQASITKRLSSGLSINFNYVWSHFLDSQDSAGWGGGGGTQNWQIANNPSANYSNSNFDVRHALKGYAVYQLPFGKSKQFLNKNAVTDEIIGGWQVSGTLYMASGEPFTVFGTQNTYQLAGSSFPNRVPGVSTKPQHQTTHCSAGSGAQYGCLNEWYNPAAFSRPANGTFGNVRRNSLYGPGIGQVNLSGGKTFSLPFEAIKLEFRADATNAFNHANFSAPSGTLSGAANTGDPYVWAAGSGNSQQISGTSFGGRTMQMQLRLKF